MTTHQDDQGIIAQLERLNLKTDSNTTSITQLAEIVKFQVIQAERDRQTLLSTVNSLSSRVDQVTINAERDRQHFQNSINEINQRQQAQLEAIAIGFREISSRVNASIQQAEIDRNTFINHINEMAEGLESTQEQAVQDRQQAAIDRQQFQEEIKRIWEYLYLSQGKNGHSQQ
jgi:hypothetical protein